MDLLHDSAFWWAVVASVWAVTSDYLGSNPRIKQNTTYRLLIDLIGNLIRGRARQAGKQRQRQRRR
jgi:hypothetical protein